MTTINSLDDFLRALDENPLWRDAVRARILGEELLQLPVRFNAFEGRMIAFEGRVEGFIEEQKAFNQDQKAFNQDQKAFNQDQKAFNQDQRTVNERVERRLNNLEGQVGNLQGGQYERIVRTKALARSQNVLGFNVPYVALNQDGFTAPSLTSAVAQAIRVGTATRDSTADLFEADIIVSAEDNRHAVFEVSLTLDEEDISRAKSRAGIMAAITGGTITPAVITARMSDAQKNQADSEGVTVFLIPYP